MKILFEYVYKDTCYGETRIENERTIEKQIDGFMEMELPPCDKRVKVTINKDVALLQFANGIKITATFEKTPFAYEESYELFGDVRYKELIGTVKLI